MCIDLKQFFLLIVSFSEHVREGCRLVLDIGTGFGLYSLAAAKSGAATVVRGERLVPVAKLQERIVQANSLSDRVIVSSPQLVDDEEDDELGCLRRIFLQTVAFPTCSQKNFLV